MRILERGRLTVKREQSWSGSQSRRSFRVLSRACWPRCGERRFRLSLCLKCGNWKQAPAQRCGCGFKPARRSPDEAKSYVLTLQFRSPEELDQIQRSIRAGEPVAFTDDELKLASTIGSWNAAVTLSFLAAAVLTGLFIGTIVARVSLRAIAGVGAAAVLAFGLAFGLMRHMDGKVRALAGPNT